MKKTIYIHAGDEFMDYSGEARLIKVVGRHFDDYEIEEFKPNWDEQTDEETWESVGAYIMASSDLREIVRREKNLGSIRLVFGEAEHDN